MTHRGLDAIGIAPQDYLELFDWDEARDFL